MNLENLFCEIGRLGPKYEQFLKDVVCLESPTEYKAGVDACGEYFIKSAKELGFLVETAPMEKSGDVVCITMNSKAKGEPVCFSGHIDTVHPVGFFGEETVRYDGNYLYGPGVGDCKGGVVAAFLAMEALKNTGFSDCPVMLLLQTDEENSSATSDKATVRFICEKAKNARALLNVEPSHSLSDVVIERKGIAKYKFCVKGSAAHASVCFKDTAASAITEAAYKIFEIERYKNKDGITANVGLIKGGTAVNTVPAECEFYVDFRYKTEAQLKEIEGFVKSLTEKTSVKGTKCTAVRLSLRLSMPICDKNTNLLENVNKILENAGLNTLEPKVTFGGSDAADYTAYGIPVLDQLGVICEGAHTKTEHIDLTSLEVCAKRLAAIAALL